MVEIVRIMKTSVRTGLSGTHYKDRILGCQSAFYSKKLATGQLLDIGILNRIILYVTALMETKSAMGVIVAAPTAGSCGGLPGAALETADVMGCDDRQIAEALLAASMIGVFISKFSTFAAEVAGCQAECGAGSGMAAAALAALMGAEAEVAVAGASMALQNSLGMICDPVANRVEVPCLGKNVMAASNAVSCANMALAGYDPVIPLDEVIRTMDDVGKSIPSKLRCTALGGLSVTQTSKKIKEKLELVYF
jgi:L-serine dehydratase